jgi:hypothetical protein
MSVMAVDGEIVVPGARRDRRREAMFDLSEGQVAAIADALYQSPEERHRLAALRVLIEPLIDLVCDPRRTERELAGRLVRRSAPVSQ